MDAVHERVGEDLGPMRASIREQGHVDAHLREMRTAEVAPSLAAAAARVSAQGLHRNAQRRRALGEELRAS